MCDTGPDYHLPGSRAVTQAERDRLLAEFDKTGGKSVTGDVFLGMSPELVTKKIAQLRSLYADSLIVPPPPPPDASDLQVKRAMAAERLRAAKSGGMGASFLTGPAGLTGGAPLAAPKASGY